MDQATQPTWSVEHETVVALLKSVARVLHWLESEGIIMLRRGKAVVHDVVALRNQLR